MRIYATLFSALLLATGARSAQITSVSPKREAPSGLVRIYGAGFGLNGVVTFAGRPAHVAEWSDNLIECFVPEGVRPGNTNIVVTAGATSRTRPVGFWVNQRPVSSGRMAWRFKAPDQYLGARPAIGPDGTIYAIGNFGHLYALTPNGALKWVRNRVNASSTVAVLPSGNIVCGGGGGVMSLTPEGAFRWSFPISTAIGAGPNVGPDGRIYFIDNSRWGTDVLGMIILDDLGNLVWNGASFYRRGANNNPAEIAFSANRAYAWSDGAIAPPFSDTGMNAFSLGGGHVWNDPNAVGIQVSANPGPNVAYCTTSSVTMKSPTGATIWSSQLSAQPQQIVATSSDGSTYLATLNARLNAWNANGSQRFSNIIGGILNWLSVSPNGQNVVVQTSDFTNPTQIKSFSPQGVEQWSFALPNEFGMNLAAYSYMNFTPDSLRVIFGSVGPYTSQFEAHSYLYSLRTQP